VAEAECVAAPAAQPTEIAPIRYRDIGGLGPQIRVVRENLELPLRFPALFVHLGVEPHRGLLLSGPPGTGKTMLARALATEAQATFLAVNGPEILSKWRGESEANLRRVFAEARDSQPAVVLIDEVDAIAPDRSRVQHNHEAVLVSQVLTLLDGLSDRGQVVVVATTNRPDLVDPAVRRPGRLDLLVEIGLPDEGARRDILRIHSTRMPLAQDVNLDALAAETSGFAGAHLGALCREAGMECMREVVRLVEAAVVDGLLEARDAGYRAVAISIDGEDVRVAGVA
jgi:transitional endoplasmic reticulum ATPase